MPVPHHSVILQAGCPSVVVCIISLDLNVFYVVLSLFDTYSI